jgi:hypothetical protein
MFNRLVANLTRQFVGQLLKLLPSAWDGGRQDGKKDAHFVFVSRSISRSKYHRAFFKSSILSPFSPARQMYFMALPRQKFMCSVTVMHSTPLGCVV